MNSKSFLLSSIAGFIVYFILGALFYGVIFTDIYPSKEENENAMLFIALGCLFYAAVFSLIYTKWAQIKTFGTGLKTGFLIGLLYTISMNFFMYSSQELVLNSLLLSVLLDSVSAAIMGGVIGLVHGKTNP